MIGVSESQWDPRRLRVRSADHHPSFSAVSQRWLSDNCNVQDGRFSSRSSPTPDNDIVQFEANTYTTFVPQPVISPPSGFLFWTVQAKTQSVYALA